MALIEPLLSSSAADGEKTENRSSTVDRRKAARVASLDVFRGLCVFLMMLVDYAGSIFPIIAHSPWNGVHLADFVMPFFLFVAGISTAIAYKKVTDRVADTQKALLRAFKLFLLGVFLQGGYFHGVTSLTYGVDVEKIRLFGILQRIAIGYVVAALCEIWLPCQRWCVVISLLVIYLGLLYGLYVPDWQYVVPTDSFIMTANNSNIYMVNCCVRGDLGPACNSAGMIDRYILGIDHLYAKPVYRNLKECNISSHGQVPETSPSWCRTPFDPEGILSSLTAAVTSIIGLQYGHILIQLQGHKERLWNWSIFSVLLMSLGLLLCFLGMPLNKSLYTISYLMVTTSTAGFTFCLLYALVDVYEWRCSTYVLEWMGKHSLIIFILVTSNIIVIMAQGFYLNAPQNNIVHWIITRFVHK
ncbi:hypothetical protein CASFOL_036305 [Castilleja foliolosa]|uniref:Heparan-alpha-glucosaminide N-acetyltransferase catalytic domain-containing protein n=1 Tax=Castilleja foliolosa TaxID=1961234 RepID=A0ABD3BW34_9LAMI